MLIRYESVIPFLRERINVFFLTLIFFPESYLVIAEVKKNEQEKN